MVLIIGLSIVTEALIEYAKQIGKAFEEKQCKTAVTQLCAVLLSVILCVTTGADLFTLADIRFSSPLIGEILTGILASRGANYISDLASRLSSSSQTAYPS